MSFVLSTTIVVLFLVMLWSFDTYKSEIPEVIKERYTEFAFDKEQYTSGSTGIIFSKKLKKFLSYNHTEKYYYLSNKPYLFNIISDKKSKILIQNKNGSFMRIVYPNNFTLYHSITSSDTNPDNSNILSVFDTQQGKCIKFYNGYYLSMYNGNFDEINELVGSKDHSDIFYFDIMYQ
ncbi:MAG TPA: hypothetical protein V6C58_05710 [Allocoleopsis sp.]